PFRQRQHVTPRLGVGEVKREGEALAIFGKAQGAGARTPQHLARIVVKQGEDVPAERTPKGTGGDTLDKAAKIRLAVEGGGVSLDTPTNRANLSEGSPLHIAPGQHQDASDGIAGVAVVTSSTETKAAGCRTATSTVAIALMLILPL